MLLESDKLYYLSNPYTTYGNKRKNLVSALKIEKTLIEKYKMTCINPTALPLGNVYDICMKKCRKLLEACDVILLCPNWQNSEGCNQEVVWAKELKIPVYELVIKKGFIENSYSYKRLY